MAPVLSSIAERHAWLRAAYAERPVLLAPMEDVSDAVFRALCRARGADVCFTEFVNCEGLLRGSAIAKRKLTLTDGDQPTAVQIYGSSPERLAEAARVAEASGAAFIDLNCGCWVPKVAGQGAGAGWLRDPSAMVAMARMVVDSVSLPVTVKTRIGLGPESHMPVVDLSKQLEDAGVAAITLHCRTAEMGHKGRADWAWAARVRSAVRVPVIVNGDVRTADDARRALDETGCAGVMIGRRAIEHPWVFREARALLDRGDTIAPPTRDERLALAREHLERAVDAYGPVYGLHTVRKHLPGYLHGLAGGGALRASLHAAKDPQAFLALLDGAAAAGSSREAGA